MALEQLEDIIEEIADKIGIYGTDNPEDPEWDQNSKRNIFVTELEDRIRAAIKLEDRMRGIILVSAGKSEGKTAALLALLEAEAHPELNDYVPEPLEMKITARDIDFLHTPDIVAKIEHDGRGSKRKKNHHIKKYHR